ncbi:hypothetical protein TYRP_020452 [Tyrophagus putrescentiae]|nr:hypothetical protein TYRP_020452 [Tyrophagus putrescentiae]
MPPPSSSAIRLKRPENGWAVEVEGPGFDLVTKTIVLFGGTDFIGGLLVDVLGGSSISLTCPTISSKSPSTTTFTESISRSLTSAFFPSKKESTYE